MPEIKIDITNKVASQIGTAVIVCGNDDYTVSFTFDNEWGAYQEKTARFRFTTDAGKKEYIDVLFSGSTCAVPILSNIDTVSVGVYAGDLQTTTGADIKCQRSILCGQGTKHEAPDPDVYNQILEACSQKLSSNGGTVTGDYYKDGNVFIHEGNLEKIDPRVQGLLDAGQYINPNNLGLIDGHVQGLLDAGQYINAGNLDGHTQMVDTATGSAITIESANAPLQQLKLFGSTTQDGTPTPTEPKELKSVGDSGSFKVGVYGKNLLEITATTQTVNGVTFTVNADKSITVNGTATANVFFDLGMVKNELLRSELILKGGVGGNWDTIIFYMPSYDATGEVGACTDWNGTGSKVNLKGETGWARIFVKSGYTVNNKTFYPMLYHESLTDTTYEPYKAKQSITLTDTLRSVGEVKDEVDFTRGVTTQRFAKSVFNGSENWQYHETRGFYSYLGCKVYGRILTNLYPTNYGVTPIDKTASTNFGAGTYIWVKDTAYSDIDSFKSALATNPLIVIYEIDTIETPISETELNAYRQLMTNSGNTTILSEATAEATYYTNKPNGQALGAVHAQINRDYLKIQQAIIQAGGSSL